ncbi:MULTISPECIES: FAD-dependent oxidoreductase [unclassified Pseudodesulfovibrio]|uniref:FAD-dependent oxidoreductase n=1 Tax=unclassified Pseudodesulfovibrio TaxID=2661612 RepID=UPI000FEBBE7B|nr:MULTISPECIES: FAD-dependent oxidoreductase [unclassified Pseudodesulfovibrio]MCJ2164116.1 FAD-dependent oxidoreductase [Pseudodesulfovibrio sp. S3-i]RWU05254.1 pyridine nucleotide-disulfide oxidoreductase [Pseudodesulfovibrio sp. S3]
MAKKIQRIDGHDNGVRIESRILEERIQTAVRQGGRRFEVDAMGQHGIGGRLWISKEEPIFVSITGSPGQRIGSKGFPGTTIEVCGPASDDVGWLNAGAEIIVHGNVSNGACNAMAQGKVFVAGNTGSRCMTMTKTNPRFEAPELWVLGSVGDYFAEFMAGGTAVICGHEAQSPKNVLGYRPCVGMVGGRIFVRGSIDGYSQSDAVMEPIDDESWTWLTDNLSEFLNKIKRTRLLKRLTKREEWQLIRAKTPFEKKGRVRRSMADFRVNVWDSELGRGGMIGDLTDLDRSPIPLIVHGDLRRRVPVWENRKYMAPCQSSCPTGMPVQKRWQLVRDGLVDEAVDLALAYTPFPATVCGYLCPNLCMEGCTRSTQQGMAAVDITKLGREGHKSKEPKLPALSGKRVAVIGGGPAGISVAWQIRMKGHEAVVFDMAKTLGGKIASAIPYSRVPKEVVEAEVARAAKVLPHVHLQQELKTKEFEALKSEYDYVVLAIGAQKPRMIPVPGHERIIPALTFLQEVKKGTMTAGKRVVIIGAGNVGCDVATVAATVGAEDITLIDIQEPASFGKERKEAEAAGARFKWPCFTKEITDEGVLLQSGELLEADTVIMSIGDQPDVDFLPDDIALDRGHVVVNDDYQTTDSKVFAIGDLVRPGLLTHAIGHGRRAAEVIDDLFNNRRPQSDTRSMIDYTRMTLEYFDPRVIEFSDMNHCGSECSSCGSCRDCYICDTVCPQNAIIRNELPDGGFERVVDPEKCIACGFCADSCPCGIWDMKDPAPME